MDGTCFRGTGGRTWGGKNGVAGVVYVAIPVPSWYPEGARCSKGVVETRSPRAENDGGEYREAGRWEGDEVAGVTVADVVDPAGG